MPLIACAVVAYTAGLWLGFSGASTLATLALAVGAGGLASLMSARRGVVVALALALVATVALFIARDTVCADASCMSRRRADASATPAGRAIEAWRGSATARIDTLYGADAPLVRALLVADMRTVPGDVRDRFAASGLVHILSISGLHVAIIAGAVLLLFEAARMPRARARWAALAVTALYVVAIGAPPPALRSATMLGVTTVARSLQRPTSPWAALALGAALPLADPRVALDLGWQLSVAGFASLTAAQRWARRTLPHTLRGWRRAVATDFAVSVLATVATAPLVAWAFGRLSLVAPLTNLAAGPVVAVLQPALFLALVLSPWHAPAAFVADASRPLLHALMAVADAGARVPGGAVLVAPSLAVAVLCGLASVALVTAAASRRWGRPLATAVGALAVGVWWPSALPAGAFAELHVIDVGQGDAIAVRTPAGRWLLFDAGRNWRGGDAGRSSVIPYLRRWGGELVFFSLSHPHADHVGGGATVLRTLHPNRYLDAAFAGGSEPYRASLETARAAGIAWARVHPGDSLAVDSVTVTFLAPDSVWTTALTDPNLASTVAMVRFGAVRFLLTGDAEGPEEAWLLARWASQLHADVLKVGHHGSATSSTDAFVAAVRPRVAIVSVGARNSYGHPSNTVMQRLLAANALVLRTDQLGSVVVRTDGRIVTVRAGGRDWRVP